MTEVVMLKVEKIKEEYPGTKSFFFNHTLNSQPGQFVMIWLPGLGEKPMSIAADDGKQFYITISGVGPFSKAIQGVKEGDTIGIRGPLGTHFNLKGNTIALVGGGYGAGPMAFLAELAVWEGMKPQNIHYVIGARTKDLLLFEQRMKTIGVNIHITTDDGTQGKQGRVTDALKEIIEEVDTIYCVGPEMMEKAVYDLAQEHQKECEISLERYTKCGIGICGSCCVDPTGWRMCIEGPVLNQDQLKKVSEFGKYHRDATGKKNNF
ncbi:MAG: dihydroorotate dehydrogenase electron transfer subunit [Nanoarchaeota archaeon]|nr:dihydroorotate dehydrogenase electron transfer subunit [Nanoarchaeota archaeon]